MRLPGKLNAAKTAIHSFLENPGPEDLFGLIAFADSQVAWITHFTSDAVTFGQRLNVQEAFGQTALYDALGASPRLVDKDRHKRKAIVLFTDGLDNASRLTALKAVWLARRVSVPIYTISFLPVPRDMLSKSNRKSLLMLERFSQETGGALFPIRKANDLHRAVDRIQQDLRSQYVIGFSPAHVEEDRSFHLIRLETQRSHLQVRTRKGYYPSS